MKATNEVADRYRPLVLIVLILLALYGVYQLLQPFFNAILWATVLSILFYPWFRKMAARFNPTVAALLATLSTLALIVIPVALLGLAIFFQVRGIVHEFEDPDHGGRPMSIQSVLTRVDETLQPVLQRFGARDFSLSQYYQENKKQLADTFRAPVGKFLINAAYGIFTMVVALLTMFFMLRDGDRLLEPTLDLIPLARDDTAYILERIGATVRSVFIGIVLVGIIQGTLAGLAYAVAGVDSALLWTMATIFLCMVPLLGAPIIYIPLSIALMMDGRIWAGVGLLAFCGIVVSQVDNFLRPYVIGTRVNLHYMTIFFSLLGGVLALGPIGIFAGPMFASALLAIVDVIRRGKAGEPDPADPEPEPAL